MIFRSYGCRQPRTPVISSRKIWMGPHLQNTQGPMSFNATLRKDSQGRVLGFPKICEWRRLESTRVSQSHAIGQTWTTPETPGLTRPWWNNGHGRMTQTRSHAQHHGRSTNDSPVQVSPKEQIKIGAQS